MGEGDWRGMGRVKICVVSRIWGIVVGISMRSFRSRHFALPEMHDGHFDVYNR